MRINYLLNKFNDKINLNYVKTTFLHPSFEKDNNIKNYYNCLKIKNNEIQSLND